MVVHCRLITYWPARSIFISGAGPEFRRNSRRASPVKVVHGLKFKSCRDIIYCIWLAALRGSFLRFPPIEATKPEVPRARQHLADVAYSCLVPPGSTCLQERERRSDERGARSPASLQWQTLPVVCRAQLPPLLAFFRRQNYP